MAAGIVTCPEVATFIDSTNVVEARAAIGAASQADVAALQSNIYVGETSLGGKQLFLSPYRSDGLPGLGTLASPLNASTPERIDNIMAGLYNLKTPATVTFLPHPDIRINMFRPHETWPVVSGGPYHIWNFYNGLRIKGCGKGVTTFKPSDSSKVMNGNPLVPDSRLFFSSSYKTDNSNEIAYQGSVEDCTFDAEVTTASLPGQPDREDPPGTVIPGISYRLGFNIYAGDFQVKNVEFANMGGRGQEQFPFTLLNAIGGAYPYIPCNYLIEGCSTRNIFGTNGCNLVVAGDLSETSGPRPYQRVLFRNNHLEECGITWASFNNVTIRDNYLRNGTGAGKQNYGNINYDTGHSSGVEILDNHLIDAIAGGVAVGNIIMGNWLSKTLRVRLSDILIKGNTFRRYPDIQGLWTPGVIFIGGIHNWNISDNFYEFAAQTDVSRFSKRGFVSARGTGNAAPPTHRDDGTTALTEGQGWGSSWNLTKTLGNVCPGALYTTCEAVIPTGGPQEDNSPGIMFNNKLIHKTFPVPAFPAYPYESDHGSTPLGMENKLMSALT